MYFFYLKSDHHRDPHIMLRTNLAKHQKQWGNEREIIPGTALNTQNVINIYPINNLYRRH